mgnify:CR=1 FL=1
MKPIYISDNDYFKWQYNGNEYVLHIQQDSDPEDPRTLYDHDCLMACFHRRYTLGDTIDQREPEAFWQGLVRKYVPEATLFNKANAKPDEIPDRYTWEDNDGTVYGNLTSWKVCLYYVEDLTIPQCQSLLYPYLVSLPLWLYDHSGITISCGDRVYPYNDRWDSGLVGWIVYARQKDDGEDWRERAFDRMRAEVEEYDHYLTGEVYGFTLYENGEETDSCWDFYGDDLTQNGILDEGPGLTEALASDSYTTGQARKETTVTYYFD